MRKHTTGIITIVACILSISGPIALAIMFYIIGCSFYWWLIAPIISLGIAIPLGIGLANASIEVGDFFSDLHDYIQRQTK